MSSSIPTVTVPRIDDAGSTKEESPDAKRKKVHSPMVGRRCTEPPDLAEYPTIAEDGSLVAIWTNFVENGKDDGNIQRHFLAKRVDGDSEILRTEIGWPKAEAEKWCPNKNVFPGGCPDTVGQARREQVERVLSSHEWSQMECYVMHTHGDSCWYPQELSFANLTIKYSDLVVRLAKPTGETLIEKKLPPWPVYYTTGRPGRSNQYIVDHVAIDFERRVLLVALTYCEPGTSVDMNRRFHVFRFPPLQ